MKPAKPSSTSPSVFSARLLQPDDGPLMRVLFQEVFGHEMPQSLWEWKYAQGRGRASFVFQQGEGGGAGEKLVAHYGGICRQVLWEGRPTQAVQICDVMVSPKARHSTRRHGPFGLAFTTFAGEYGGYGRSFPLGFGFPNDRHMRLAELQGHYALVGKITEIRWPARPLGWAAWVSRAEPVTQANLVAQTPALEACWQAMARSLRHGIIGLRHAQYLKHRYLDHPTIAYGLTLLRRRLDGSPLGVLVTKEEGEALMLMDLVAHRRDIPLLLAHAQAQALDAGKATLKAWCTRAYASDFAPGSQAQTVLPISIPTNVWSPGPSAAELRGKWWLMAGDTDFL